MTHTDIVKKLIGNIQPCGESQIDEEGFKNLKAMCELVSDMVCELRQVAENKYRHEYSMKIMGEFADSFLTNLAK